MFKFIARHLALKLEDLFALRLRVYITFLVLTNYLYKTAILNANNFSI